MNKDRNRPADTQRESARQEAAPSSGDRVASPLAPSAESTPTPVVTEPRVRRGAPVIQDLPASYMEDRLVALPHDPDGLLVYWDVSPATARRFASARWGLLIQTRDGERLIEIAHGARNWYIHHPNIVQEHEIRFGPIDASGTVHAIASTVWTPRPPAERSRDEGAPPEWGRAVETGSGLVLDPAPGVAARADSTRLRDAARLPIASVSSAGELGSGAMPGPISSGHLHRPRNPSS